MASTAIFTVVQVVEDEKTEIQVNGNQTSRYPLVLNKESHPGKVAHKSMIKWKTASLSAVG
jgi:hypothetical protein